MFFEFVYKAQNDLKHSQEVSLQMSEWCDELTYSDASLYSLWSPPNPQNVASLDLEAVVDRSDLLQLD